MGAVASFLKSATQSTQRPCSTIASLSTAIGTLYETTDFHPTRDPLLAQVKRALVCLCTTCPIKHGAIFNTSTLCNLFLKWGSSLSIQQLRTKLLAMLCMLGALRIASTTLPKFDQVTIITTANNHMLSVPIVGYKNDLYGNSKQVFLHKSSNKLCCPVQTFEAWKKCTHSLHHGVRNCPLLFSLQRPIKPLSASKSAFILKELATYAGLDPAIFTAKTFCKSGIMAGIDAGVAIPRTYTNLIFDINESDTDHLRESTL